MNSLNEITTEIASHFEREQDEPFKAVLAKKVDAWRSKLIVNSLEKHPEQRKFFRQTLYIPMSEESPLPDCITGPDMCKIAESVAAIPGPMRLADILFDYVGTVDGTNPFREITPGTLYYLKAGRYSKNRIYYEWSSLATGINKIKIFERSKIPTIRIDGVFDNPLAVMEFNCNNAGECDGWDLPYPVTGDIKQMIVQYILQVDYQLRQIPDNKEIEVDPQEPKNEPGGKGR